MRKCACFDMYSRSISSSCKLRLLLIAGCALGNAALAAVTTRAARLLFDVSVGADISCADLFACVCALQRLRTLRYSACATATLQRHLRRLTLRTR
jgi:hypothetical protein